MSWMLSPAAPAAFQELANLQLTIVKSNRDPGPIPPAARLLAASERAFKAWVGVPCPKSKRPLPLMFEDDKRPTS